MKDPRHDEFEALRQRAVEIGRNGETAAYRELLDLMKSEFPIVRKAAAGSLVKLLERSPSLAGVCRIPLFSAIRAETGEQVLQYMLKAFIKCAGTFTRLDLDLLRDLARNSSRKDYVRAVASEAVAAGEAEERRREALRRHWCARCRRPVTAEESARGIAKYGKPYCHHCMEERALEGIRFEQDVEKAKVLRTTDAVAVQSRGEKRIGDWLAAHRIAYVYDERIVVAGDLAIRPDFYLPEFDIYIEYWGMNTPEYVANMKKKRFLYQRDHKRLVSLSYRDFDRLEELLAEKLSRYLRI